MKEVEELQKGGDDDSGGQTTSALGLGEDAWEAAGRPEPAHQPGAHTYGIPREAPGPRSHARGRAMEEALQHLKNWKPHRDTQMNEFNREAFLEEMVDAFNYFLSVLVQHLIGMSAPQGGPHRSHGKTWFRNAWKRWCQLPSFQLSFAMLRYALRTELICRGLVVRLGRQSFPLSEADCNQQNADACARTSKDCGSQPLAPATSLSTR